MHRTNGMNNWNARSGYRYRMSVPGPIIPMEQKPALVNRAKQVVSALAGFGRG